LTDPTGRPRADPDICGNRTGERPDAIKLRGFCHFRRPDWNEELYRPADLAQSEAPMAEKYIRARPL
jgi:hypothetical protein